MTDPTRSEAADLAAVSPEVPGGPLLLSEDELAAMPGAVREGLMGWLTAYRSEQARRVWHTRAGPPSRVSLGAAGETLMRALADPSAPMAVLDAWLRAYQGDHGTSGPFQRPHDLVVTAVGSRRLDVLTTVLDVPAFCPVERTRETWPTMRGPTTAQQALLDRHGPALFNGGFARGSGTRTTGVSYDVLRAAASFDAPRHAVLNDGFADWAAVQVRALRGWTRPDSQGRLPRGDDPRDRPHLNVVGLAVMMGWAEGVQALLDHGVDLYARDTKNTAEAEFISPVVLAAHYGERDSLVRLLAHPGIDLLRRYGYTAGAWERRTTLPANQGLLWPSTNEHFGGMELRFVLNSPLADDPAVRAALQAAYDRLTPGRQRRLAEGMAITPGLLDEGRRRWEGLVLEHEVRRLGPLTPTGTAPTRARL